MDINKVLKDCFSEDLFKYSNNLFKFVREIPYEINWARTPEALLEKWKGYCVTKHRLLKKLFGEIGVASDLCFVPFRFNQIYLPESLRGRWYADKLGYHVFLKVYIDGEGIDVDASFPEVLSRYYKVNAGWDGKSSQEVTIWTYEEEYIVKLDDDEREVKKKLSDPRGFDAEDE